MALCIGKKKKDRPTQKKVGSSEEEYFSNEQGRIYVPDTRKTFLTMLFFFSTQAPSMRYEDS